MTQNVETIIVEKTGTLKSYCIKDYNEDELYKKCGFKKQDGFDKQTEWNVKLNGQKYIIHLYGKLEGKANTENKYDFPPPLDNHLFFGNCILIGKMKNDKKEEIFFSLTLELWEKIYEKLFGGFEDLVTTAQEDEEEEDELANIPDSKKTKNGGYLKDGFVVDSDQEDDEDEDEDEETECEDDDDKQEELPIEDIGSELSEESYDYSEDDEL